MLVYRLYKSTYIADPLSAEGARRAGGRWNPKGFPILYTSATPELALLEVVAHLNPSFIPGFHLLVLDIPEDYRAVLETDLPPNWQDEQPGEALPAYLSDWLKQPDVLTVSVPSAIVSRSRNYLLHTLYPGFSDRVRIVENEPFRIDARVIKGST
ncbi:MAG: RES family NAD+ phosphorylase [Bacteroidetes bacterium]|nr:RES family NAD+ phosphorylase [Fibrella sp.]